MKIVPVFRPETKSLFADDTKVAPWVDKETNILTSALAFGKAIDLIGIGQTTELINSGLVDMTDSLSNVVKISAIHYAIKGQKNIAYKMPLDVTNIEFKADPKGSYNELIVSGFEYELPNGKVTFNGKVNLELGNIKVDAVCDNKEIELLGYEIASERVNLNRRPKAA